MFTDILKIDSFWEIIFGVVNLPFLVWSLKSNKYVVSFLILVFCSGLFVCFGEDFQKIQIWIQNNPGDFLFWVLCYFGIGFCYSILNWIFVLVSKICKNNNIRRQWLMDVPEMGKKIEEKIIHDGTVEQKEFVEACKDSNGEMTARLLPFWENYERHSGLNIPRPEEYKLKCFGWAIFWPFFLIFLAIWICKSVIVGAFFGFWKILYVIKVWQSKHVY